MSAAAANSTFAEDILVISGLTKRFGGLVAVDSVDMIVPRGSIAGLIGPNGAGKTTIFNMIAGIYQPSEGEISFDGAPLVSDGSRGGRSSWLRPDQVTARGIARTFQNIRLFHNMSALDNVLVGADAHHRSGMVSAAFGLRAHREAEVGGRERARELLEFVGIASRADDYAKNLPYGDQRRLEIARALATQPKVLLLDEPAAGMNPAEKVALQQLIRKIRDAGRTILLIEHDMSLVMGISDRIGVLDFGEKIAEGDPDTVRNDPRVVAAYLGAPADAS